MALQATAVVLLLTAVALQATAGPFMANSCSAFASKQQW